MANWSDGKAVHTHLSHNIKALIQTAVLTCMICISSVHATELVGRVVDNSDARVFSGAAVQIRKNKENPREALSNSEGFFRMSDVPAGAYIIDINLSDGRAFMTRLMINPKSTTQFIELDYSRIVTPDDDEDY